jgi:hypothetical protein
MLGHAKSPIAKREVCSSDLVDKSIVAFASPIAGKSVIGEIDTSSLVRVK